MTRRPIPFFVMLSILAGGCAAQMQYTPKSSISAQPKPDNCDFEVLTTRPQLPFDEVGVIDFAGGTQYDSGFREGVPDRASAFKAKSAVTVCRSGGDAVVAEVDNLGQYIRGTVIRYQSQ